MTGIYSKLAFGLSVAIISEDLGVICLQSMSSSGPQKNSFLCGCSIVSANVVLTAAHCLQ
jgi:hypothetical protein